jgi:hypothetical protein
MNLDRTESLAISNTESGPLRLAKNATTGIVHMIGGSSSLCGASRKNRLITLGEFKKTAETSFCLKCFNAKPSSVFIRN